MDKGKKKIKGRRKKRLRPRRKDNASQKKNACFPTLDSDETNSERETARTGK